MSNSAINILCSVYANVQRPYFIVSADKTVLWANESALSTFPSFTNNLSEGFRILTAEDNITLEIGKEITFNCSGLLRPIKFHVTPILQTENFLVEELPIPDVLNHLPYATDIALKNRQLVHRINSSLPALMSLAISSGNDEDKKTLAEIAKSCMQLLTMTDHLAKYTAMLHEEYTMDFAPVPVCYFMKKLTSNIVSVLRHIDPDIAFVPEDEEVITMINQRFLSMAITQLVDNALTHNDKKEKVKIVLSVKAEEDHFILSVSDSGQPLPPSVTQTLFDPFVSSLDNTSEEPFRLGLGLTLASMIAKAHGGKLKYERTDDQNRFSFVLPIKVEPVKLHAPLFDDNHLANIVRQELAGYVDFMVI